MNEVVREITNMLEKLPDSEQRLICDVVRRFVLSFENNMAPGMSDEQIEDMYVPPEDLWVNLTRTVRGVRK